MGALQKVGTIKGNNQKQGGFYPRLISNGMQLFRIPGAFIGLFLLFSISSAQAAGSMYVPFTSQAPFGDWSHPWQEFCEEASVVMAAHFIWNAPLTPKIADLEMRLIKQYEELVFGKYQDTSAEETAFILKNLYGFKNIVHPNGGSQDSKPNQVTDDLGSINASAFYRAIGLSRRGYALD